jgi:hypothetical protein
MSWYMRQTNGIPIEQYEDKLRTEMRLYIGKEARKITKWMKDNRPLAGAMAKICFIQGVVE